MSSKTLFITLTPFQLFFFGGEQGEKADYYLRGSFMPQQTALLGLIRHQVLLQNNLMLENKIVDDTEAEKWIGTKSFEYDKENDFSKILQISPCYLVNKNGKKYLPYFQRFVNGIRRIGDHYLLTTYDPKEQYPSIWKEIENDSSIKETDCYEEIERIGVDKNYSGKTENDSFFKQIWLKMKNGFSFGFYVTLLEEINLSDAEVTFGKESSPFFMKVDEIPVETFKNVDDPNALVLISDAFVSQGFLNFSDFAVCDTVPFRNNVNPTSGNHKYYSLNKSSVRLQLMKRGSIFLSKNGQLEKMETELNAATNFQNIGYNHFQLIKIDL